MLRYAAEQADPAGPANAFFAQSLDDDSVVSQDVEQGPVCRYSQDSTAAVQDHVKGAIRRPVQQLVLVSLEQLEMDCAGWPALSRFPRRFNEAVRPADVHMTRRRSLPEELVDLQAPARIPSIGVESDAIPMHRGEGVGESGMVARSRAVVQGVVLFQFRKPRGHADDGRNANPAGYQDVVIACLAQGKVVFRLACANDVSFSQHIVHPNRSATSVALSQDSDHFFPRVALAVQQGTGAFLPISQFQDDVRPGGEGRKGATVRPHQLEYLDSGGFLDSSAHSHFEHVTSMIMIMYDPDYL